MTNQTNDSFIYSAYAQSVSAAFNNTFLSDAPSAALGVTGGKVSHSKRNISFSLGSAGFLKIGSAAASVSGERVGDHFVSQATARVENFNFSDMVTADLLVATVTSRYPVAHNETRKALAAPDYLPSHFSIDGSEVKGLKINGQELDLVLDDPDGKEEFVVANTAAHRVYVYKGFKTPIRLERFGHISFGSKLKYGGKVILTTFQIDLDNNGHILRVPQPQADAPQAFEFHADGTDGGGNVSGVMACSNGKNGYPSPHG